eukprot:COSAG01_NODE_45_length_32100_cov_28.037218_7_plen_133_part_00
MHTVGFTPWPPPVVAGVGRAVVAGTHHGVDCFSSYVLIFCISNLCALHSLNKGLTPTPPTKRLVLSRNYSGTTNGLAKFFYVRDTRRAVGLDGFRLRHDMMMKGPGHSSSGTVFADAIGLGGYNFGGLHEYA